MGRKVYFSSWLLLQKIETAFETGWCMIKIFRWEGGRGGDAFKPLPLRTTFAFTHPLF